MTKRGVALLSIVLFSSACDSDRATLVMLSPTELPAAPIGQAIAEQLADDLVRIEVVANDDAEQIVDALLSGEANLGIIEEPASRIARLQTIVPLYPSILHVVYRSDRDVSGFADLVQGQSVYAGPIGGAAWRLLNQLVQDAGLKMADVNLLPDPWSIDPDVFFVVGDLLEPAAQSRFVGYRMFSFGDADRLGFGTLAEGLALKYPNVRPFILPESVYGDLNPNAVLTLATRTLLVANEDMPSNLAYLLARDLIENGHEIASEYHLVMTELNERIDAASLSLPLHQGARIYVNKDEPSVFERYAEVVGVGLTILAALVSGVLAVLKLSRARRKDRIDVFYRRVMDARRELGESNDSAKHIDLERDVKAIQEEVLELLMAERLNVDESLTLFLDLSNRVLGEITRKQELVA